MWVFLKYGFYSIACADKPATGRLKKNVREIDPNMVMVRARTRQHLRNLQLRFPGTLIGNAVIDESDRADYGFRIIVPKTEWAVALMELAMEQDYRNFKNEAAVFQKLKGFNGRFVTALHSVWDVMFKLQCKEKDSARLLKAPW